MPTSATYQLSGYERSLLLGDIQDSEFSCTASDPKLGDRDMQKLLKNIA